MVDGDTLIDCGEMGVHRSNSEKSYRVPHRYTQRANREEKRRVDQSNDAQRAYSVERTAVVNEEAGKSTAAA